MIYVTCSRFYAVYNRDWWMMLLTRVVAECAVCEVVHARPVMSVQRDNGLDGIYCEMAHIRSRAPKPPTIPSQRDSESAARRGHRKASAGREPWEQMADTYAWVEHCHWVDSRGTTTEEWVLEQQMFHKESHPRNMRKWAGIFTPMDETQKRMRDGEQARVAAARKEREKARILEELKQIESRIRLRRAMERERIAAEKSRISAEKKERERCERVKTEQAIRDGWVKYEKGWEDLSKAERITFSGIPWPLLAGSDLEDITARKVGIFLLSPLHSEGQTAKERLRRAQLRWHPDRFSRVLQKMEAGREKARAADMAGVVARCLNDLMR
ncbi:hypothetical protein C8R46DRAFT_11762 [Mycena filopes]|nr:hypothetical protein C8R46DRAFT_11762 [Mycena filopes]